MRLFSWLWYRARSWLEDTCGRASTAWNIGWFFCREGDIARLQVERDYNGPCKICKGAYDRHTKQPVEFECHKGSTSVWGDPNSEALSMEFEHPQNFRKLRKHRQVLVKLAQATCWKISGDEHQFWSNPGGFEIEALPFSSVIIGVVDEPLYFIWVHAPRSCSHGMIPARTTSTCTTIGAGGGTTECWPIYVNHWFDRSWTIHLLWHDLTPLGSSPTRATANVELVQW